ncbi:MAG: hypothetical protein QOI36_2609, partial [Pseudonocardiales bacterium]|nr:hypothetical protein [Pseudonocardiales bacterium]
MGGPGKLDAPDSGTGPACVHREPVGHHRIGVPVASAVDQEHRPALQPSRGIRLLQPGSEKHDACHARIIGDVDRHPAAERMADQPDGNRPVPPPHLGQ